MFDGLRSTARGRHAFLQGVGSAMNLWPRVAPELHDGDVTATVLQRVDAVQRRFAATAAATFSSAVDWHGVLQAATSTAPGIREAAAARLAPDGQGEPGPLAMRLLTALARDPDVSVRLAALAALAKCGAPAIAFICALARDDESEAVRIAAVTALRKIGPPSIPALISIADGNAPGLRQGAVRGLGDIGHNGAEVVACLLRCLNDVDMYVRTRSAYALGRLRVTDHMAIVGLKNRLGDSEKIVRDAAIHALGDIGPAAKDALPDLRALRARDASAADTVDRAISLIGGASRR